MRLNEITERMLLYPLWHRPVRCFIDPLTKEHVDLVGINFEDTDLAGAIIEEANLESANLKNAEMAYAELNGSSLMSANMQGASLRNAHLEGALLTGADMANVGAECSFIKNARLMSANLYDASLLSADLSHADLTGVCLIGANLEGANLTGANLQSVGFQRKRGKWRNIRLEGCYGNETFKRHALHEAFVEEFRRNKGKLHATVYWTWDTFVDCGRTPWRLMTWVFTTWLLFAEAFFTLQLLWPDSFDIGPLPETIWTMLYYSIVTLTTLGFGDVTPLTYPAMIFVSMEVLLGYIIFGCLISFLSSKMVPRG